MNRLERYSRGVSLDSHSSVTGFGVAVGVGVSHFTQQHLHVIDIVSPDGQLGETGVERYRLNREH